MPFELRLDAARRLGVIRLVGDVTGRTFAEAFAAAALAAAGLPPVAAAGLVLWVWDLRPVRVLRFAPWELPAAVAALRSLRSAAGPGRSAAVVRDTEDESIVRLLDANARGAGRSFQTFGEVRAALAWLGLPAAEPLAAAA